MENERHRPENNITLAFIIIQFFIIVLLLFSMPQLFKNEKISWDESDRQSQLLIDGLSDLDQQFGSENIKALQHKLADLIEKKGYSVNNQEKVNIRSDSFKLTDFNKQNVRLVSFLIDEPTTNQTYKIFYEYSYPTGESPYINSLILCEDLSDNCGKLEGETKLRELAFRFLEYQEFDGVYLKLTDKKLNTIGINVSEDTEQEHERGLAEVKEFLSDISISPELFEYRIMGPNDYTYIIK